MARDDRYERVRHRGIWIIPIKPKHALRLSSKVSGYGRRTPGGVKVEYGARHSVAVRMSRAIALQQHRKAKANVRQNVHVREPARMNTSRGNPGGCCVDTRAQQKEGH